MPVPSETPVTTYASPDRLWAEQLAAGLALLMAILIFLAIFHTKLLSAGMEILGPNDLDAYGWASILGILLQVAIHELGTIVVAWWMKLWCPRNRHPRGPAARRLARRCGRIRRTPRRHRVFGRACRDL
jgi:hypothetical protein